MRRFMMTFGGTLVVLGSSLIASGQDKAPSQAPGKGPGQAPMQAPPQSPKQAPMQAPQKVAPMQAPTQKQTQAPMQAPTQSPIQKGGKSMAYDYDDGGPQFAMGRPGLFRRFR